VSAPGLALDVIEGMRFSQADDGEGFQEVRIRLPAVQLPGAFRGEAHGNEARKRMVKWVLAVASGMIACDPTGPTARVLYGVMQARVQGADEEYQALVAARARSAS